MLATVRDHSRNVVNMQHKFEKIGLFSTPWDCTQKIEETTHMVEGGDHLI